MVNKYLKYNALNLNKFSLLIIYLLSNNLISVGFLLYFLLYLILETKDIKSSKTMRKEIIKSPRGDKSTGIRSGIPSKRIFVSKKDFTRIPVFNPVDDEEFFFEVDDF
jgi:hypothetical protein